jgi:hypothetical protein
MEYDNPSATSTAPKIARQSSPTLPPSAAFATPPSPASVAPHQSRAAQAKPPATTGSTAAATANSIPPSTASPSSWAATTRQQHVPRPRHRRRRTPREAGRALKRTTPTRDRRLCARAKTTQRSTVDTGESTDSSGALLEALGLCLAMPAGGASTPAALAPALDS